MKNLVTMFFCIVSFAAFSQSFNTTYPYYGLAYGDQVEIEETGFRIMGFGRDISGGYLLVIHTDSYGDTIQTRKLYLGFEYPETTLKMVTDKDGSHYVNLPYNSDSISLVKLSPDWQEVWRKKITNNQRSINILKVTDDNHIIAVASQMLFKLDTDGNIIWQRYYGEDFDFLSRPYSLIETNNELFLYSLDYWSDPDQFYFEFPRRSKLRVFAQNGEMRDSTLLPRLVNKCISNENDFICIASNFDTTSDNLTYWHDFNGLRFNEKEIILSDNSIRLFYLVENLEGNLVTLGKRDNNFVLHCMTKEGDSLWTRIITNEADAFPMDMKLAADGGYIISTFIESIYGDTYLGLIKTDAMGNISGVGFEESEINQKVRVYPNPTADYVVFELEKSIQNASITLTDITGRQIKTIALTVGKSVWQTSGIPSGVYLYRIDGVAKVTSGKLVILKN